MHRRSGALVAATVVAGGAYAAWGLLLSARPDALGAFWYLCLLGFLLWGRSRALYVGAFLVVTYLELLGTWLGTWEWQTHDPTGLVTIGNPPVRGRRRLRLVRPGRRAGRALGPRHGTPPPSPPIGGDPQLLSRRGTPMLAGVS